MQYRWRQEQRVLAEVLDHYYAKRPVHLLDFACGTGRIAGFLENRVASTCGVDVSDSMLSVAHKKLAHTRLLKVNLVEECPFPRASFNLITAFRFFLNAEAELTKAVVKALEPLLADDGFFVFNIHRNSRSLYYCLAGFYCRLRKSQPEFTSSIGECSQPLREVGMRIARVYPVGLLHVPRCHFSERIRQWVDGIAMRSSVLGRLSDSPIVVARKNPV
jgi:predicted TPR repeat methyltransferase